MYIEKYFELTPQQRLRFEQLIPLYKEWNARINVISRKDIEEIEVHHFLHALAIARYVEDFGLDFSAGTRVVDVGTGGGFPGIPLAILYPEVDFVLCDSIAKKIKVVTEITTALGLKNVTPVWGRSEQLEGRFDYVVSRAVTELRKFMPLVKGLYDKGILYLKGGDTDTEIDVCCRSLKLDPGLFHTQNIGSWFDEPFFHEKKVIYIRR